MGTFRVTWISSMFLKPPRCQFIMLHAVTSCQEKKPIRLRVICHYLEQSKNQWTPEASLRASKTESVLNQGIYHSNNYQLCLTDGEPSSTEVDYNTVFEDVVDRGPQYSAPEKFKFRSIDDYIQLIIVQQKKEQGLVYPVMREPRPSIAVSEPSQEALSLRSRGEPIRIMDEVILQNHRKPTLKVKKLLMVQPETSINPFRPKAGLRYFEKAGSTGHIISTK